MMDYVADNKSKEARSYNMSRIKSKNTKPEMLVRRFLHAQGFRYRLHVKDLPGKPDIVFKSIKTVVFIHGCFWHCHTGCKLNRVPKNNEYWSDKLNRNIIRDKQHYHHLINNGWAVLIIWECDLSKNNLLSTLEMLKEKLKDIRASKNNS